MYSEKETLQIGNFEREQFRKLKGEENKNRPKIKSDDILFISDFILEPFLNNGDSGQLFLATHKRNPEEKYIIKHAYYDCACNEYMYSKMGNQMGIQIIPVKLFIIDEQSEKFKCDFVCGIKYLEGCKPIHFAEIEMQKEYLQNWKDYFKMLCLEALFEESDGIEIVTYNNKLYRLDTTASFTISDFDIHPLAYPYHLQDIDISQFAHMNILQKAERNTKYRLASWKQGVDSFIKKYGEQYLEYYLEPFHLFTHITKKQIEEWIQILTFIYPNVIGEYFKNYFHNLKLDVEEFLIQIAHISSATVSC